MTYPLSSDTLRPANSPVLIEPGLLGWEACQDDMTISIGLLTLYLDLPGCTSLKEKRSRIKPLLARLHKEFNISAAEVERQDAWQEAVIAVAIVSNASTHNQQALAQVVQFIERKWPDATLMDQTLELI